MLDQKGRDGRKTDQTSVLSLEVFTDAESEFLKAILEFRTKHGRIPTLLEGFRIAKRLGYRREV